MKLRWHMAMAVLLGAAIGLTSMPIMQSFAADDSGDFQLLSVPPNETNAARYVDAGVTRYFSDITGGGDDYDDGDTLTVNGTAIVDLAWAGSDGSRDTSEILIRIGGILIIEAGVRLDVNTGQSITVNEGGQLRSLGTPGSRVTLMGEDKTSATHRVYSTGGGNLFFTYTDISYFYYAGGNAYNFGLTMINSTLTNTGYCIWQSGYTGNEVLLINSTINQNTASRHCLLGVQATAINCAFVSTTDNYLASSGYLCRASFYGCTYQGAAITANDFVLTTCDYDIRIYEASAVESNVAGVSWALRHPNMDSTGMVRDTSTYYMVVPGYLAYGQGNTTIYTLQKFAYWPSGLAVASRLWQNISVSGGSGTMNNEWNITASAWGYATNSSEVYSDTDAEINLTAAGTTGAAGLQGAAFVGTYDDNGDYRTNYTWGEISAIEFEGSIEFSQDLAGVYVNCTVRDAAGLTVLWLGNWTDDYTAGAAILLSTTAGATVDIASTDLGNGSYAAVVSLEHAGIADSEIFGGFHIQPELPPGFEGTNYINTYTTGYSVEGCEFYRGDTVFWEYNLQTSQDVASDYTNMTVESISGTVMWLGNWTLNYVAHTPETAQGNFNTASLPVGMYWLSITVQQADIEDTVIMTQFAVQPDLIPGMEEYNAIYTASTAGGAGLTNNFTVGATIYFTGALQWAYDLPGAYTNLTLYHLPTLTAVAWWNDTYAFTADTSASIVAIFGSLPAWDSTGDMWGSYYAWLVIEAPSIEDTWIEADFYLSLPLMATMNVSAYGDTATTSAHETNRFNPGGTAFFNGTLGTTYDTPGAVINITMESASGYLATLWNGTHDFLGGQNDSLTDICGGVLNYTGAIDGDCRIKITAYRDGYLNTTTVTEGIQFRDLLNQTVGGIIWRYPAFFEWKLGERLTVTFTDRTKWDNNAHPSNYIWLFGDGEGANGASAEHIYRTPGTYNVTLMVTFSDGTSDRYYTQVDVVDTAISWPMYAFVGVLMFSGILIVGTYGARKKSRRVLSAMYLLLGLFISVSIIALQGFIG